MPSPAEPIGSFGKIELLLHTLNDCRYRLAAFVAIGFCELCFSDGPICVERDLDDVRSTRRTPAKNSQPGSYLFTASVIADCNMVAEVISRPSTGGGFINSKDILFAASSTGR
jgi:hypothetical protein